MIGRISNQRNELDRDEHMIVVRGLRIRRNPNIASTGIEIKKRAESYL